MGRSFESIRMLVKDAAHRWEKGGHWLHEEDRAAAGSLAVMASVHKNEAFYCFDDPAEALLFSVLVEMLEREDAHVDP